MSLPSKIHMKLLLDAVLLTYKIIVFNFFSMNQNLKNK